MDEALQDKLCEAAKKTVLEPLAAPREVDTATFCPEVARCLFRYFRHQAPQADTPTIVEAPRGQEG